MRPRFRTPLRQLTLPTLAASATCLSLLALSDGRADGPTPVRNRDGFLVHTVKSPFQETPTRVRVLLPDKFEKSKRYRVLYVLPVEAGGGTHYGDGLAEVRKQALHNRYSLICVAPEFSRLPWYADHPTKASLRQESYLLKSLLPLVEREYPAIGKPGGRLLVGFSKSGWGAFSLLLRHPETFGKAAAWDAPLMMDRPGRYGSGPLFGSDANFQKYRVTALLTKQAKALQGDKRLVLLGYGNFRKHHQSVHALMTRLGIPHVYRDGPARKHRWDTGWLPEAVELLTKSARP